MKPFQILFNDKFKKQQMLRLKGRLTCLDNSSRVQGHRRRSEFPTEMEIVWQGSSSTPSEDKVIYIMIYSLTFILS